MKLLLTVLVFIVLPTAWLSMLAGRSIQARELLLDRRLETEAQQTLEQIGGQLHDAIDASQRNISALVRETVLAGYDIGQFDVALQPLQEIDSLLDSVYLFLDPWGFIYPRQALPDSENLTDHHVLLAQELAMRLSQRNQPLSFATEDRVYVFRPVDEETRLFAGFQVDQDGVIRLLEELLRRHASPHIAYRLLSVHPVQRSVPTSGEADLQVRDSFSIEMERLPVPTTFLRDRQRADVLVSGHLGPPFGYIEIGALAVNASEMYAARALQARLVRWSIFLLAFVLLSSVMILILMARKQAERARIRSVFIAGLSHDIRTPVTAMRALAESLQQGRVSAPERKQQFFNSIVDECDRLQILIERVLLFFRQEQGGYYQKQIVDLVALCERVSQTFCSRHRGRIEMQLDMPQGRTMEMFGDPTALEQALHNLLENAWKYGRSVPDHPDHTVPVLLRLSASSGCIWKRCLHVCVEDAGPGIPPSERKRIFGRFYRGRADHVKQAGGIGLGLALVWEIVRSHGGKVEITQSSLGGACFTLRFKPYPLRVSSWKDCLRVFRMKMIQKNVYVCR